MPQRPTAEVYGACIAKAAMGSTPRTLRDQCILSSMSDVGHCSDNAAAEGFFGKLKRERIHRRRYRTLAEARADVFDYIEQFRNPLIQRKPDAQDQAFRRLTQPSVETG